MKKKKLTSTTIATLLLLSTLTALYTPIARSGSFEDTTGNQLFFGSLEPQVVLGGYDGKEAVFQFSITSNTSNGVGINKTMVKLPSGWTNVQSKLSLGNTTWQIEVNETDHVIFNCTAGNELTNGTVLLFNITAQVKVGIGMWNITCYTNETTPKVGYALISVTVTPYFDATISPSVVKSAQTKDFNIIITNNASTSAIYKVNITYPSSNGWSFNNVEGPLYWVLDEHDIDNHYVVYRATGGAQIDPEESVTFTFTMRTGTSNGTWSVICTNTAEQSANMTLKVYVDDSPPSVSISSPTDDSYVSGTVWINASITQEPHLEAWSIKINGTQIATGTTSSISYQWDTTEYVDGVYEVNITAADIVGNVGSDTVTVTVDNTVPQLIQIVLGAFQDSSWYNNYTAVGDTFWVPGTINGIKINATFSDVSGPLSGSVYFNMTAETFNNNTWIPANPYDISGMNSIPITINITDQAGNRYVHTWIVSKDFNIPATPTYTEYEVICGGIIIKGINSTDAESGIDHYNIYINGTIEQIAPTQLDSATWYHSGNLSSLSGVLVINLTAYAGSTVNITITSVDKASMESNATTIIETIPEGLWFPIVLHQGWNLISLPLIPNSTDLETVLELMVKAQSFADVVDSVYYYDASTREWKVYIPGVINEIDSMEDGKGYFIRMKAYDVLIIQGREKPVPPATPPVYMLYQGWNLIGFKEISEMGVSTYFTTVPSEILNSAVIFGWNSSNQEYYTVWVGGTQFSTLKPGEGYWIYVIEQCSIAPP